MSQGEGVRMGETKEKTAKEEKKAKQRSWKVDFIMGIAVIVIGLPFFAVDYKIAGIVMEVIGVFCVISGLCQRAVRDGEER